MTYLTETRWHWFSLDSTNDLSTATLELSTDGFTTSVVAAHDTAPASASAYPAPGTGQARYWWKALVGPGQTLELATLTQAVEGRLTDPPEVLYPEWVIYSEDDLDVPYACWPIDEGCLGPKWAQYNTDVQDRAVMMAVEALRMLTGYRVGGCPVTLRPCAKGCTPGTWRTYPVSGPTSIPVRGWQPVLSSGTWLNIGCGCGTHGCSCTTVSEVILPSGAASVTDVFVDGLMLPDDAYRVDNGNRLVRLDGGTWPLCQDMTLEPDAVGTFAVIYTPGVAPGKMGALAAGLLAVEFAKACSGQSCSLPSRAKQVARAGVTIDLSPGAFPDGMTGIREADLFIQRLNPHALRAPSTVWSPDVKYPRATTIPKGIV